MLKNPEEYINYLVKWTKDYVEQSHAKGAIIGISGGIDSALVLAILKKALNDNVFGLILPCYSSIEDVNDAITVLNTFNVKWAKIELNDMFDIAKKNLDNLGLSSEGALANTKVRLRMTTLYQVGQALNYLVAGTDNLDEQYVGYFTKYGDGGVDFLPIAQLTKAEVRELSSILGVPSNIVNRVPSAGLKPNQTDESDLQVTYNELDDYLLGKEVSIAAKERIEHLHKLAAHKLVMPPKPNAPTR